MEGEEGRGRGRRPQRLAADQTLLSPAQPSAAAAAKGAPFTCVFVGQRHKAEGEDVAAAAGVALEHGVTQRGVSVQGYLAGLGLNLQQRRGGGGGGSSVCAGLGTASRAMATACCTIQSC